MRNTSIANFVGTGENYCEQTNQPYYDRGFLRTVASSSTMDELEPLENAKRSGAFDVVLASQLWIAGRDDGSNVDGDACDVEIDPTDCYGSTLDGLVWRLAGSPDVVLDRWMPPGGVEARSINNQGNSVGFGFEPEIGCPMSAFRWDSAGNLSNLGAVMPPGQAGENCRAEAIGNPGQFGHVRVAGSNDTDVRVYVWEHNGVGEWEAPNQCVVDVHDEVVLCGQTLTFNFTHDMNNNGHIVVHGKDTLQNAHVAVLGCVADINHDMRVNGTDRDILHLAYGACANCNNCPSDLDCDCDVDASDFAQLQATWSGNSPCRIVNFCPDPEGGEGFAGELSLLDKLNAALEVTGFSSVEDFLEWASTVEPDDADNMSLLIHLLMTE